MFDKPTDYEKNKIEYILQTVQQNYVDSVDMNSLIESSIEQTLKNLDPHSIYMNKAEVANSMDMMQGSFEGIGVEFSIQKDTIIVINVIPDGPSEKEGLQAGDRIVSIENENVAGIGITNQDVITKLRGQKGSIVKVGIKKRQQPKLLFFNIKRGTIPLNSLDVAYEIAEGIGYIKLNRFSSTTFDEFKKELTDLVNKRKVDKLILDLRGNSGGYLDQAIKILNEFFEHGKLLVYTEGSARKKEKYFSNNFGIFKKGDLCVLIDSGSASASEIIAGAIQDQNRGMIIGEKSFGKGLVQEQIPLKDGSLIRLTVARYYTPSGRCIQKPYDNDDSYNLDTIQQFTTLSGKVVYGGGGISPDVLVDSSEELMPTSLIHLYTSAFFNNLVFEYVDNQREGLNKFEPSNFNISESESLVILNKIQDWFVNEMDTLNHKSDLQNELIYNQKEILNRLTALIIRQYWGWGEMQMFLNQNDAVITSSLSLLKN